LSLIAKMIREGETSGAFTRERLNNTFGFPNAQSDLPKILLKFTAIVLFEVLK